MNIFRRRKTQNGVGNLNPKRLGIIEEIYGEDVGESADDDAGAAVRDSREDQVLVLDKPLNDGAIVTGGNAEERRSAQDAGQKAVYLGGRDKAGRMAADADALAKINDVIEADAEIELPQPKAQVILLANVKGGCGKSTAAMHLALYLIDQGHDVGAIDLDGGQGTLTRMMQNRRNHGEKLGIDLPAPELLTLQPSAAESRAESEREDAKGFAKALETLQDKHFIIIDTPGTNSVLVRLALRVAGILITPVNDSFLDLDVLAHAGEGSEDAVAPSDYTRVILEERKRRTAEGEMPLDWVVVRSRLSSLYARNKAEVAETLERLSQRFDFRLAAGFGERVVFREFFPKGLTLLDLRRREIEVEWSLSHVAAREELRQMLAVIGISGAEAQSCGPQAGESTPGEAEATHAYAHEEGTERKRGLSTVAA